MEEKSSIHEGLRFAVGRSIGVIYTDDVLIRLLDLEWIQGDINGITGIFLRVVLMPNIEEYKTTNFQLGEICTGMS